MFSIIDRYIAKKFFITFFFIILFFILIAIVFDFAEKIDDFLDNQAPVKKIIFEYYLNFIPYFINLFSPLFIFISAVFFTSRMAYNTEFIAMLSSGINFYRLLKPYFIVAFVLALLSWYLNNFVIPRSNEELQAFEDIYIKKPFIESRGMIHRQIEPNVFIFLRNFNDNDSSGSRFTLEKFNNTKLRYKLMAQRIKWIDSSEKWMILNYTIRTIDEMRETMISGDTMYDNLQMTPTDFAKKSANMQIMNSRQLSAFIKREKIRGDDLVTGLQIELYKRSSMPFATFILVFIAFALSSRRLRGGTGLHLGLGILIAFSYIFFMQFSTVFSTRGNLDPLISVWIPNFIFAAIGIFLIIKAPK